jgi:hypothetical protein
VDNSIVLFIRFPQAEVFKFSDGGLSSDLTPQEEVEHGFFITSEGRSPVPVLEAGYDDWSIGEFSLRMLCVISKNSSEEKGVLIKSTIILFPESRQHLLDNHEMAQSAAWPGVKVLETEFPLLPRPTVKWRCPVNPLLMPGTPFTATRQLPAPDDIRAAIAAIMGRDCLPETCRTGAAAVARWRKIGDRAEELVARHGPIAWPKTGQMQQEQGKLSAQ